MYSLWVRKGAKLELVAVCDNRKDAEARLLAAMMEYSLHMLKLVKRERRPV
jgi:hypothetical protein